jgi:hypothetical protein
MSAKSKAISERVAPDFKQWLSKEFSDPARFSANLVRRTTFYAVCRLGILEGFQMTQFFAFFENMLLLRCNSSLFPLTYFPHSCGFLAATLASVVSIFGQCLRHEELWRDVRNLIEQCCRYLLSLPDAVLWKDEPAWGLVTTLQSQNAYACVSCCVHVWCNRS